MKRQGWLILIATISILLYFSFIIYSGIGRVGEAFKEFSWGLLPGILSLVFASYLLRASRWHYYLRTINIAVSRRVSYLIFLAGQSMTITPGKIGELIKPYLLKDKTGTGVDATIPVVFIERLTDLLGMTLLASLGLISFQYGAKPLIITTVLIAAAILVIQHRPLCLKILEKIGKVLRLKKYIENFTTAYNTAYSLLKPKRLALATLISFCAWGLECLCMYLVFIGLGVEISLLKSTFIFAFSSIIGGITMLPGGLGAVEGSLVGLMVMAGATVSQATAATLIIRLSTLWFAVIIGLVVLQHWSRPRTLNVGGK